MQIFIRVSTGYIYHPYIGTWRVLCMRTLALDYVTCSDRCDYVLCSNSAIMLCVMMVQFLPSRNAQLGSDMCMISLRQD